ncbi:PREDICTED: uncharacterized protein LOC104808584 isoform X2 [Tarenaya hassleriana]|uniref:uncharacterized protein LOC104808584 isoform X1 n=1 Tax=Tarenaya hassleriana TaxID=28532 RepID=UPI00053C8030|nr:PREDICTED: uncharacterized protein LOC104808584 isoform X1 [Tarenaya hassleriana]XP_010532593.1 PREDICTED: uncharacterized protein LOC104808584 isoform X2 [Tarenaya hassleriana]
MPFPMKIQPIDIDSPAVREPARADSGKPVLKSRLKRLFDRPFTSVLRSSTSEKPIPGAVEAQYGRDGGAATEFEPSSVCLAKMVQNFIEENNEKQSKCGRNRCNCFIGNNDRSDDELDLFGGSTDSFTGGSSSDASDYLKSLIPCASVGERNLLADAAKIVEKNKSVKRKDDMRKIVNEGLLSLGYDSSICKSKWEKSPSFPAGEYEYIDVIVEGERLLIDVDFRSEFEIARQTGAYKAVLQCLPFIFAGKPDRLGQIVSIVSEAAKQSLKKKGMHFPPWRKAEYMRAKWLSSYTRASVSTEEPPSAAAEEKTPEQDSPAELELIFGGKPVSPGLNSSSSPLQPLVFGDCDGDDDAAWQPPPPRAVEGEAKAVTGLASLFKEKP